ncbi:GroES-like protein [Aureobasidium pullulans]|uniref:GroES-like protein n=1 Tax=Aureobasidium pullulans TaxID=5580 RepID=A0A4S9SVF9_AURPU|nr:GroES-like protein [Aureobasidium pullulans]
MAPSNMKAIKVVEAKKAEIQDVAVPKLRDDYVLVKVDAVALNPTDWKHIDYLANPGATVGCDYAGTVEEVGSAVQKKFSKGDRIAGFSHGVNSANKEDGCFAQYALAKGDVQMKVPESLSTEDAATLGVGVTTVGQGLYQSLKLPLPTEPTKQPFPVLIYGASTATGTLAVQYAKLSGLEVIAICSPHNWDLVKSLGADATFDYKDPECSKKIREHTKDNLKHAFDCISEGSSPDICGNALSSKGGVISFLLPAKSSREDVEDKSTLGYTVVGEAFSFGGTPIPAKPEDFEFGRMFWELAEKLFADGKVKAHPKEVRSGGLEGIFGGLNDLKTGKVSGTKLVYKI